MRASREQHVYGCRQTLVLIKISRLIEREMYRKRYKKIEREGREREGRERGRGRERERREGGAEIHLNSKVVFF